MGWFREYSPGIVFRFCLMFALWIFYNIVPYTLPRSSLFVVTGLMVAYALQLFKIRKALMAWLMLVAALSNTIIALTPGETATPPVILFVIVFVILLFDIVSTPQRGTG
jgi:hypothetical protein